MTDTTDPQTDRYRKLPVEVEARQLLGSDDGEAAREIAAWCGGWLASTFREPKLVIPTLEGDMVARPGDWVVRGVKGEFYPVRADIFAETYAPAAAPSVPADRSGLRERIAALFRHPPGVERLGDATPGEIATAVLSVLPSDMRADVLRDAEARLRARAAELVAAADADPLAEVKRGTDVRRHSAECWNAAADELRRLAAGERDEQQAQQDGAETLAAALDGLHTLIATSSRDWGPYRVDAWLWAVLVGWDCEEAHEHDELCEDGAAMREMADRHGWDEATVAKARRYRAAVRALTDTAAAPVAGQPPADTGEEAREEIECANCWRVVENRSTPNMGGPSRDNWVHVPGGFQPCFPQRGADSPRAEPELTVVPQPETVHGCPPDGSGLTPCCGRTPFELPLTDRISSEVPVTCTAPPAVVAEPGKGA